MLRQPLPENGLGQEGCAASSLLQHAPFVQEFPDFGATHVLQCNAAFTILYWTPSLLKGPRLASFSGFCFIFVFTMVSPIVFDLVFIVDWVVFSIFLIIGPYGLPFLFVSSSTWRLW